MNTFLQNQTQYTVLETTAKDAVVSLYPELTIDRECVFIGSGEWNNTAKSASGFYFTVNVKDQNFFRFDVWNTRTDFYCSISVNGYCPVNTNTVFVIGNRSGKAGMVCNRRILHHALYKVVGRMRL